MEARIVGTNEAWSWVAKGWQLFGARPGMWLLLMLTWALLGALWTYVAPSAAFLFGLLGPALYAGVLYGASELDHGRPLRWSHLFRGLSDRHKTLPFLGLGLLTLIMYAVLITLAIVLMMGPTYALWGILPRSLSEVPLGVMLLAAITNSVFFVIVLMASVYAAPLVLFAGEQPTRALKSSFLACTRNWMPLVIFSLIVLLWVVAASIILLFVSYLASLVTSSVQSLGFLLLPFLELVSFMVLYPLMVAVCCAAYASYQSLYGQGGSSPGRSPGIEATGQAPRSGNLNQ